LRRSGSDTRDEIVEQALQLFTLQGYHNTSISDLLAATGLTKGGLYGHFGSKEEIWAAAYRRAVEIWSGIVFRGVHEVEDPIERIQRVIEQDLGEYVGGRVFRGGCFFFNLLVELSGQSPQMAAQILRGYDGFSERLARWIAEGQSKKLLRTDANPREIADFLVIALNGATALFSARQDPNVLERATRQLRHYLDSWRA
jgi:TetR/AcrR family transcriptional regulator, transcriptional repressor for nem operon